MVAVLLLGSVLGLDSLRASLGLGVLRRSRARRLMIAVSFGVFDGLAPLLGLALGSVIVRSTAAWTGLLGPVVLGGLGLYLLLASPESKETAAESWLCLGLPLTLSLDNLIAGFGLGVLGTPVLLSAFIIGLISGLLSLVGLCLGSLVGAALPARAEQVGGMALTVLAVLLAIDVF